MNLHFLRTFVAIADNGGVTRAAARLNLTQSAASRQIQALENELGLQLFARIGRNVRLTREGEDLLVRSRRLLADVAALGERASALKRGDVGVLRLGHARRRGAGTGAGRHAAHEAREAIGPAVAGPMASRALPLGACRAQSDLLLARRPDGERMKTVIFACVHNAGRSQMAAGFLRALGGGDIEVLSAGYAPKDEINPVAVAAMAEVGIDIAGEQPKVLTVDAVRESDVVITMGCGDACPIFPGKRYEDWELDDPAGRGIDAVRPIRDEIRRRIEALVAELTPA